jgi:hypothetical protein
MLIIPQEDIICWRCETTAKLPGCACGATFLPSKRAQMIQSKDWDITIYKLFIDSLDSELSKLIDKSNMNQGYAIALQEKKKMLQKRINQCTGVI